MMKSNTRYWVMVLATVMLTACTDWLDVGSKSEVNEDEMFRTAEGYYATLTGLYLNLGSTQLYGGNLPLLALEPLTQQYSINTDKPDRVQWSQFNYQTDGGQQMVSDIWLTMYNTIVNANMILQQLDHATESGVNAQEANILRGEALGLRALMYLDLLRLFNDAPAANPDCRNVPFKTDFGFELGEQLTTATLLDRLATDLQTACRLLQQDPLVASPVASSSASPSPTSSLAPSASPASTVPFSVGSDSVAAQTAPYLAYDRRERMNLDACTALLARLELYRQHDDEAARLARQVIDSRRYRYIRPEEIVETDAYGAELRADRLFVPELIFALYTENILTTSRSNYEGLTGDFVKTADLLDESDVRRQWLFSNPSALGKINLIRYQRSTRQQDQSRYGHPVVPMLKLSEMQLIVAECALRRGDVSEARLQLNTLRMARGEAELPATATLQDLDDALTHEYQCDFRGEGQLFYYYKRRGFATIDDGYGKGNTVSVVTSAYTLPLPPYEIQFGYGKKD